MGYPSLLYLKTENEKPLDISVFGDLQLLNFISSETVSASLVPCTGENITARQKLFESANNSECFRALEKLYQISDKLFLFKKLYDLSRVDEEKYAVFAAFAGAYFDFLQLSSKIECTDPLLKRFAEYFHEKVNCDEYKKMKSEYSLIDFDAISEISVKIHGSSVRVGKSNDETYLSKILGCAEKLGCGEVSVREYSERRLSPDMILAAAKQNKDVFSKLGNFYSEYSDKLDFSVIEYRSQIAFCIAIARFLDEIRSAGIPLTYPETVEGKREICVKEAYDVSLLAKGTKNIVPNDIEFNETEPFFFLTGANGGGKTTYLRTVGITAVMYLWGCPVPAVSAKIGGLRSVCTHFPRDERFDGSGRFVEENRRVDGILQRMDNGTLILLNETYSTTNEENAIRMTEKLASELWDRKAMGLYITHQHSLSQSEIPYLNVLVDRSDANRRTYKIVRQKESCGSFAGDILEKYGLTSEALKKRFGDVLREEGK